jgi:hypothetical protein
MRLAQPTGDAWPSLRIKSLTVAPVAAALGTLILDFADGAQLTVPSTPIGHPDESWLLDYRDLDDDEPERRLRWHRPRLRRLRGGGGFKPPSRGQRGWSMRTAELSRT